MSIKTLNINYSIFFLFLIFVKAGSRCVSTVETGSRLTCLAVVNPEGFLKQLKQMTEEENTAGRYTCSMESKSSRFVTVHKGYILFMNVYQLWLIIQQLNHFCSTHDYTVYIKQGILTK